MNCVQNGKEINEEFKNVSKNCVWSKEKREQSWKASKMKKYKRIKLKTKDE